VSRLFRICRTCGTTSLVADIVVDWMMHMDARGDHVCASANDCYRRQQMKMGDVNVEQDEVQPDTDIMAVVPKGVRSVFIQPHIVYWYDPEDRYMRYARRGADGVVTVERPKELKL